MSDERESRQGRQAILHVVREADQPLSVAEIAERVGLHVNTVRGHLELLVHLGNVSRETEHRGGRGRPRVLYELATDEPRQQDAYRTLAAVLANELSIVGGTDQGTADEAGLLWAQALVEEGRLLVELVERLVCRLYDVPDKLTERVIASAVARAGAGNESD